jgi:hypothetical protein
VKLSTPSPDGDATSARRPPCTSRRSSPMAAVHGQRGGDKTTAGARRDLGDTHRRIASRAPQEQRERRSRTHGKASALVKMASCRLGCWIIRLPRPCAPVGTFQPAISRASTGPRMSPQPEALRYESNDGPNGTQEYAQTAPEAQNHHSRISGRASRSAKKDSPKPGCAGIHPHSSCIAATCSYE